MDGTQGTQLDLHAAIRALWRRRWVFLGVFVSIPVAVLVISLLVPKTYEAYSLIRTQSTTLEVPGLTSDTLTAVGEEALLVDTEKIREAAAEELGESSSQADSLSIQADPVTTSDDVETDLLTADRAGRDRESRRRGRQRIRDRRGQGAHRRAGGRDRPHDRRAARAVRPGAAPPQRPPGWI